MGGKIRYGYIIVSGIVKNDVKDFIDSEVDKGHYLSRSHAIGFIITEYVNNKKKTEHKINQFNDYKHNALAYKQPIPNLRPWNNITWRRYLLISSL